MENEENESEEFQETPRRQERWLRPSNNILGIDDDWVDPFA